MLRVLIGISERSLLPSTTEGWRKVSARFNPGSSNLVAVVFDGDAANDPGLVLNG